MARRIVTDEEKVAIRLGKLVSDVSLDLDEVGMHLAQIVETVLINRLIIVIESAVEEKDR